MNVCVCGHKLEKHYESFDDNESGEWRCSVTIKKLCWVFKQKCGCRKFVEVEEDE